jgi:glyoxylase-like metal-dependent hydrolase (beta-lactamase superfamily II)
MKRIPIITLAAVAFAAALAGAQAQEARRAITQVAGDVYRFQNNSHHSLVVATSEGVVVDPINADAAEWLRSNLGAISDQPVTHLIYSHSHRDHASGGSIFSDGATVIAHANAPAAIDGVVPDIRFSEAMSLEVGGKTFELTWLGPGHGTDLIAVVVRPENVGFITDAAAPRRLPFRDMPRANIDAWIDQVRKVESLDFEIFAPAHGVVGVKADATDVRVYMERLKAEVVAGLRAGKSVAELVDAITLDDYRDWMAYDRFRELNILGMARFVKQTGQDD